MSPAFSKKTSCAVNDLFNHCLQLHHFLTLWKGKRIITLPKTSKDTEFLQNLCPLTLFSTTGELFEKLILRTVQKHTEEINLLNTSQFGFQADHSTTLHCMGLADHITLNFSIDMSVAAVFLDIMKAFGTTWHSGLLYNFSELEFSTSLIKLITSSLADRKIKALVEGEFLCQEK
jgi:hypothetical protein